MSAHPSGTFLFIQLKVDLLSFVQKEKPSILRLTAYQGDKRGFNKVTNNVSRACYTLLNMLLLTYTLYHIL